MLMQFPETYNVVQGSPTEIDLTASFFWSLRLLDTFTDADNTLLTGHTPSPTNTLSLSWQAGGIRIVSNRLTYSGS